MRILLILLFSIFVAHSTRAEDIRLAGKVAEVLLYPNQAQLTLKASITLLAGEHTLRITRTAGYIDPRTLQVRGTGDFTIVTARLTQEFLVESNLPAATRALKDSVDELHQDLDVIRFQADVYKKEEEMMLENRRITGLNTGLSSTAELQRAADFFRQRMLEIKAKLNSLEEKTQKAKRLYEAAKAQLDLQTAYLKAPVQEVAIMVRATKTGPATLYITYLTDQAGWSPSYDARASEGKPKLDLVLKAQVRQSTGLDWEKVKLQFSSGNPGLGAEKPTLSGLQVEYEQPRQPMYMKSAAAPQRADEGAPELAAMAAPSVDMVAPEATMVQATLDDGGLGLLFTLDQTATVPTSTADVTTLEIRHQELDAAQHLVCAPALDPDVFVLATLKDWGNQNLLPGPVQVFYEGVFTGESFLPASTAQDSLQLSLGRERKVLVRRIAVPAKDAKNLLGTKKIQVYAFETTVVNNRKESITLRIEDRIPVSRNEQITVEQLELSGAAPDEQGLLRYDVTVAPGSTKKQALRYQIRYPKDKAIFIH